MFKKFLKATTVVLSMSIIIGVGKPVQVDAASTYVKAKATINVRQGASTKYKSILLINLKTQYTCFLSCVEGLFFIQRVTKASKSCYKLKKIKKFFEKNSQGRNTWKY